MSEFTSSSHGEPGRARLRRQAPPRHRILVADDDRGLLEISAKILAKSGYAVDAADDGAMAWKLLNADVYDLLITDHNMPKMTGVELLKRLRAARMKLPVIMVAGTLPSEELKSHPRLQPAATLRKPYAIADLLRTVQEVLSTAKMPSDPINPLSGSQL